MIYTRTGRAFFADPDLAERTVLDRIRAAIGAAGLWAELDTDWLVLDAELLPWSAKAGELLRGQYAPVAAAATTALDAAAGCSPRPPRAASTCAGAAGRRRASGAPWPAGSPTPTAGTAGRSTSVDDLRLAPFQILAGAGAVHALRPHAWHLDVLGRLVRGRPGVLPRPTRSVAGHAGRPGQRGGRDGLVAGADRGGRRGHGGQARRASCTAARGASPSPASSAAGRSTCGSSTGPEYSVPANLARLRSRNVGHKRALALREFALGIEALERFVAAEPLYRVHECVFGVLALESEPVDPRL